MPHSKSMASGDLTITLCRLGSFRPDVMETTMRKLLAFLIALGPIVFAVAAPSPQIAPAAILESWRVALRAS
jgi:malic enzyme